MSPSSGPASPGSRRRTCSRSRAAGWSVLEDGAVGGGETGRTTAHLSNALDDRYYVLERLHGQEGAGSPPTATPRRSTASSPSWPPKESPAILRRLDGYLFVPPGDAARRPRRASSRPRGAPDSRDVRMVPRAPATSFNTGPCLRFPRQAQFHPLAYLRALVAAIQRRGRTDLHRHPRDQRGGRAAATVATEGGARRHRRLRGRSPRTRRSTTGSRCTPSRRPTARYVIGARVSRPSPCPSRSIGTRRSPITTCALQGDLLIVGGEDHKTGQEDDGYDRFADLEAWARERFPVGDVEHKWSGQVMEPVDGLAFIGHNPGDKAHIWSRPATRDRA